MAINKKQLVDAVAEKTGLTKKDSAAAYDAVFAAIEEYRAERKGRDFQTGEEIVIPATKVPGFKAGKALKEAVK